MIFIFFSNANIEFAELKKLTWRSYDIAEILSTTNRIEIIDEKEFAKVALDKNSKTFVMYVIALEISTTMSIYLFRIP